MHKPFEILDLWVREGRIRLAAPVPVAADSEAEAADDGDARDTAVENLPHDLSDQALFDFAMRDVKSLGWSAVPLVERPPMELQAHDHEQEALRELEDFIRHGNIEMEHTPEYIEASVQPHGRLYLNDLRSGRFSVQAHLDLHGLTLPDARYVLDEFILESVRAGFSCIRVIHGRGRHSRKRREQVLSAILIFVAICHHPARRAECRRLAQARVAHELTIEKSAQ